MRLEAFPDHQLTGLDAARDRLLAQLKPLTQVVSCKLDESLGRVLAQAQHAPFDVPSADYSAMDGFAVAAREIKKNTWYKLDQGARPVISRVLTGATLPAGTDAVIPQEQVERRGDGDATRVRFAASVSAAQYVRKAGEDFKRNTCVLPSGHRLCPHDLGILAALGSATVPVLRTLRVGIVSTGDELIAVGSAHKPGGRYDINRHLLMAFLRKLGVHVEDGGTVTDERELICAQLKDMLANVDCIVSSGGVSVGDKDYMCSIIRRKGSLDLWGIAVRPGKPFAFGHIKNTPIFALPGNPASVLVLSCLLLRACLLKMQGCAEVHSNPFKSRARFDCPANARQQLLRAHASQEADGTWTARAERAQSSGTIGAFARSNALLSVPAGCAVCPDDELDTWWLTDFY